MIKYFILICVLSSLNLFGDAGNGYRFYLELISKNSDTISGYFYHYPYNEYDKFTHYDQNFKNFIKKDSIALYSFISTVNIGNMNIDFSKTDFKKTIDLNKYDHIRVIDYLDFGGGVYIIKELNKNEYALIEAKKSFCESVNIYDIEEYCHLHFLSWKNNVNKALINKILADLRNYKKDELNNDLKQDNGPKFFEYLNKIKESLLKKNILLIQYCESC